MNLLYAADPVTASSLVCPYVTKILSIILYPLISLLMGVALLFFVWGVFRYIAGAEGDEARETGKRHMLFGVIGFVIMVSALAILQIAIATFGISFTQCQ